MKCDVCGYGVGRSERSILWRVNPIGELPSVWRHKDCGEIPQEALMDLDELLDLIAYGEPLEDTE